MGCLYSPSILRSGQKFRDKLDFSFFLTLYIQSLNKLFGSTFKIFLSINVC